MKHVTTCTVHHPDSTPSLVCFYFNKLPPFIKYLTSHVIVHLSLHLQRSSLFLVTPFSSCAPAYHHLPLQSVFWLYDQLAVALWYQSPCGGRGQHHLWHMKICWWPRDDNVQFMQNTCDFIDIIQDFKHFYTRNK